MEKKQSKPEKVTCERCGLKYNAGAPHSAFCHGNVPEGAKCCECGFDEHDNLYECERCGEIVCLPCKEEAHDC